MFVFGRMRTILKEGKAFVEGISFDVQTIGEF